MNIERQFFELLQVTVGNRNQLTVEPTLEEWLSLRRLVEKQALTGIVLHGIDALPERQRPPKKLLLDWIGNSLIIRERNKLVSHVCKKLVDSVSQEGFSACILKGQANHYYYGAELGQLRNSGDVDIWIVPKDKKNNRTDVKRVLSYVYKKYPVESLCWLHVELKPIDSVPVEVHLRPSFFNTPLRNYRFLKLFDFAQVTCHKIIGEEALPTLKKKYDIVFQLNHMYRHLLDEGIGLRQVMDFYYLITSKEQYNKHEIQSWIKKLGMWRFTSALMYVLEKVLGLKDKDMICNPSETYGRFLLSEIMEAGNFGHYDSRMQSLKVEKGHLGYQIKHAWRRMKRNIRFLSSYPEEVIWEPVARFYHFFWRLVCAKNVIPTM